MVLVEALDFSRGYVTGVTPPGWLESELQYCTGPSGCFDLWLWLLTMLVVRFINWMCDGRWVTVFLVAFSEPIYCNEHSPQCTDAHVHLLFGQYSVRQKYLYLQTTGNSALYMFEYFPNFCVKEVVTHPCRSGCRFSYVIMFARWKKTNLPRTSPYSRSLKWPTVFQ